MNTLRAGLLVLALTLSLPTAAHAGVYLTKEEALREAFGEAEVERRSIILDEAQVAAVQKRANTKLQSKIVAAYIATIDAVSGDHDLVDNVVLFERAESKRLVVRVVLNQQNDVLLFHVSAPSFVPGRVK